MRILHFVQSYFPVLGGTTTRLHGLFSGALDRHIFYAPQHPSRYILNQKGLLEKEEIFENIKVVRCKLTENFKTKIPFLNTIRYIRVNADKLSRCAEEAEIDIVHGHNPLEFAEAACSYAKRLNKPFIYEIHTLSADTSTAVRRWFIPGIAYSFMRRLFIYSEKRICRRACLVIVQTERMKNRVIGLLGVKAAKIRIIPNGVDSKRFDPLKWHMQGQRLRHRRGWSDKVVFMYSGFLDHINGANFFINSIKNMPKALADNIKIVIAGKGPFQKSLEDISKKGGLAEYIGMVDYADMPAYYSACDVFVIPRPVTPTADNVVIMKLLEAMAMKKIVLASNVYGVTDLIDGSNGVVFNAGDMHDFFKKVAYILKNIKNMDGLRREARASAVKRYSWQKSREKLSRIYKEAVKVHGIG